MPIVFNTNNFSATSNPTVNDDQSREYSVGSLWANLSSNEVFICIDNSLAKAIWEKITTDAEFYQTIQYNDAEVTERRIINFTGSGIVVTDNQENVLTEITLNSTLEELVDKDTTGTGNIVFNDTPTLNTPVISNNYSSNGITVKTETISLADDTSYVIPAGTGWGKLQVGDNEHQAEFYYTSSGIVTLGDTSSDISNTDVDSLFCIIPSGTQVAFKNRLGSIKDVNYHIHYK